MSTVFMIAGMTLGALGQLQQAQQQKAAERYNARIAEMQAESIKVSGEFEEAKLKRQKRTLLGKQRALYGKAGVLTTTGSPLEVMADTAAQMELDIAANRYNVQVGISQALTEAAYRRKMARSYGAAGGIKATTTLLTGVGSLIE